jgi:hypothetical protein
LKKGGGLSNGQLVVILSGNESASLIAGTQMMLMTGIYADYCKNLSGNESASLIAGTQMMLMTGIYADYYKKSA